MASVVVTNGSAATSPRVERDAFCSLHLSALAFFATTAAVRILYVEHAATPISSSAGFFLLAAAPFIGMGAVLTLFGFSPRMATLANAAGLILLACPGATGSAALIFHSGREFPLIDQSLAAADQFLGFDWIAYVKWFDRHPITDAVVRMAYDSVFIQPFFVVPWLALTLQVDRLYAYLAAMVVALFLTCAIALVLPALGAYEYFGMRIGELAYIAPITADKMTAPILWLRAAAPGIPMPPIEVGLISFPSYHACAAVIYTWAAWRVPALRWNLLVLNGLMLTATPVHGSHYLIDVIAGVGVAAACIACTAPLCRQLGASTRTMRRGARAVGGATLETLPYVAVAPTLHRPHLEAELQSDPVRSDRRPGERQAVDDRRARAGTCRPA